MKKCTKCGAEYPATSEYFRKRKDGKGGLDSRCRTCCNEKEKIQRLENYERLKIRRDNWRKKEENASRIKQQGKAWMEKNAEKFKEYRTEWRIKNKEKILKQQSDWIKNNPFKSKCHQLKHRCPINTPNHSEIENFYETRKTENNKYKCEYCGCELDFEEVTIDHKIPRSRGGDNRLENLAISCIKCNVSKGTKILPQFEYLLDVMGLKEKKTA